MLGVSASVAGRGVVTVAVHGDAALAGRLAERVGPSRVVAVAVVTPGGCTTASRGRAHGRRRRDRVRLEGITGLLYADALAAGAGTTYADLVHRRIAIPLGLEDCYTPTTVAELRPSAIPGTARPRTDRHLRSWRPAPPG